MNATPLAIPESLPKGWENGRCRRGHDITDPANVRVVKRRTPHPSGGGLRVCRRCALDRDRARRSGTTLPSAVVFPDRVCDRCGKTYSRPPGRSRPQWARQRYCGPACAAGALADYQRDRAATGSRPGPLDEASLARLRRMVGIVVRAGCHITIQEATRG